MVSSGNARTQAVVLPKLNHLFQTAITGAEEECAKIEETLALIALQKMADFVSAGFSRWGQVRLHRYIDFAKTIAIRYYAMQWDTVKKFMVV